MLSTEATPLEWHEITAVWYSRHEKEGKTPSLRVDYVRGYRTVVSEWICLEHTGYPRQKAEGWWRLRDGWDHPVPRTVLDALGLVDELPKPIAIATKRDGKYTRVVDVRFGEGALPGLSPGVASAAPAAQPCVGCDHFVEHAGFCTRWNDTVPQDHQSTGCPEFRAPELPF